MGRDRRTWTDAEDAIVRSVANGDITATEASARIHTGHRHVMRRMYELGLCSNPPGAITPKRDRQTKRNAPQPLPVASDSWVPIAHKPGRFWKELDGAPISITAARIAVAAGRATMAHRRVDGGWDLMFKVVRA